MNTRVVGAALQAALVPTGSPQPREKGLEFGGGSGTRTLIALRRIQNGEGQALEAS